MLQQKCSPSTFLGVLGHRPEYLLRYSHLRVYLSSFSLSAHALSTSPLGLDEIHTAGHGIQHPEYLQRAWMGQPEMTGGHSHEIKPHQQDTGGNQAGKSSLFFFFSQDHSKGSSSLQPFQRNRVGKWTCLLSDLLCLFAACCEARASSTVHRINFFAPFLASFPSALPLPYTPVPIPLKESINTLIDASGSARELRLRH